MRAHLVGHWKFDDINSDSIDDDSGNELHGKRVLVAQGTYTSKSAKFTRGLHFDGKGGMVQIPHNTKLNFGKNSFTFTGWMKTENFNYPMTTLGIVQGYGCFFAKDSKEATPGWDIGHGLSEDKTNFCIRDDNANHAGFRSILHDSEFSHAKILNKWTHYALVFNRVQGKVFLYLNGKRQQKFGDISNVKGSISNNKPLSFGFVYGWKLQGSIDEFRLFDVALTDNQITLVYNDHNL